GVYTLPVFLNRTLTLHFVLDSCASDVAIPPNTAKRLVETSTITESDFIGHAIYKLADGSKLESPQFYLRELIVGKQVVRNVVASIGPEGSSLLLGQSFLSHFGSWTLNNEDHVLVLSPRNRKPV